jgi:hypothetical protein
MAAIFNTVRAKVDKDGVVQRVKYKDPTISLGYGLYLGEVFEQRSQSFKVFFLMSSYASSSGSIIYPSEIKASPRYSSLTLEELPFSKKFTAADQIVELLTVGNEYWFAYCSIPTSSTIEGRLITYESLELVTATDIPGFAGVQDILKILGFVTSNPSISS